MSCPLVFVQKILPKEALMLRSPSCNCHCRAAVPRDLVVHRDDPKMTERTAWERSEVHDSHRSAALKLWTDMRVFIYHHVPSLKIWKKTWLFRVYGGLYYPLMQGLQILDKLPSLKLTAKAPKSGWLENQFPFEMAYFQGRNASFREGRLSKWYVLVLKPVVLLGDNGNGWFKFTWLDYINTEETSPKRLWEISNWDGSHSPFKTMLSRILQTWDMTLDEKDKRIKGSSKDDAYQTMSK